MASTSRNSLCGICEAEYNGDEHKPLLLPCGHSYCRNCLQRVEKAILDGSKKCPYCRSEWSGVVEGLPVCFQLIPLTEDSETGSKKRPLTETEICQDHTFINIYWCSSCEKEACKMCCIQTHSKCKLILLEDADTNKKIKFAPAFEEIQSKLKDIRRNVYKALEKTSDNLEIIQNFGNYVKDEEDKLVDQETKMKAVVNQIKLELKSVSSRLAQECSEEDRNKLYNLEKLAASLSEHTDSREFSLPTMFKTFLEMKDDPSISKYINTMCQEQHGDRPNNKTWYINDDASAIGAYLALCDNDIEPEIVAFRSTKMSPMNVGLCFLPHMGDAHLEILLYDSFFSTGSPPYDMFRISGILEHSDVTRVRKVFARLDSKSMRRMENAISIGQLLVDADDLKAVKGLDEMSNLEHLYLSVTRSIDIASLSRVDDDVYENIKLLLVFPDLKDDDITWMMHAIEKLTPEPDTSVTDRIYSLCLPRCLLTVDGMKVLLGLVHGGRITTAVDVGDYLANVSSAQLKTLEKHYTKYGVTLYEEGWLNDS